MKEAPKKKKTKKRKSRKTNPNDANQYVLDPRQKLCWDYYVDPDSETFSNAYQSAIKAGYTEATASQITTEKWFIERVRRLGLLSKAEQVLEDCLDIPIVKVKSKGKVMILTDPQLVRIKQDTAKFIAETQGKNEGYSKRKELTGKDGAEIIPQPLLGGLSNGNPSNNSDQETPES